MNKPEPSIYNHDFYQRMSTWATDSARVIVPWLIDWIHPRSVIDIGCGDGSWLQVFRELGVRDALGIDGGHVTPDLFKLEYEQFIPYDLNRPIHLERRFDLAVCLEVAEHLPKSSTDTLIDSLVGLSDIILFSAAIPFQPGDHHINPQWPDYWISQFLLREYQLINCLKYRLWDRPEVTYFYKQNIALFVKPSVLISNSILEGEMMRYRELPNAIITPELYTLLANEYLGYMTGEPKFTRMWRKIRRSLKGRIGDHISTLKQMRHKDDQA